MSSVGGAGARADDHDAATQLGVAQSEVQHDAAAHREADEVRLADLEVRHQSMQVGNQQVLRVGLHVGRNRGWWEAALTVRNAAVQAVEGADLGLPGAIVARELVAEDHRESAPRVLVIQLHSVHRGPRHSSHLTRH